MEVTPPPSAPSAEGRGRPASADPGSPGGGPHATDATGADPPDAEERVRREAALLAAALAESLAGAVDDAAPTDAPTPGDGGEATADATAPPSGEEPPANGATAPPGSWAQLLGSPAVTELLTGAGLIARGGLEVLGAALTRLLDLIEKSPEPIIPSTLLADLAQAIGRATAQGHDAGDRPPTAGTAGGYRRPTTVVIPVVDADRGDDLA